MPQLSPLPESELLGALERGSTLLTVNRRLSRSFLQRFHSEQQAKGRAVWETPDILPWGGWIARCLQRAPYLQPGSRLPVPLGQDQELVLWEEIIRGSEQARGLIHLSQTAREVQQAWVLFRHWELEEEGDPLLWSSPDHEAFLEWSREFRERMDSLGWLEEARQPEYVARLMESGSLSCPRGLILAGFEQMSPVQLRILEALQSRGCPAYLLELQEQQAEALAVSLADRRDEIQSAALWSRTRLRQRPEQRIGVIVPDLAQVRTEVVHVFESVLHPEAIPDPLPPQERIFDVSLGRALSDYPLVQAALTILDLTQDPLPLPQVSAVLASSFVQGADLEALARGKLEAALRQRREPAVDWGYLLSLASSEEESKAPRSCPRLAELLQSFRTRWEEMPVSQAPSLWARDLDLLLKDMGWPGDRSLQSREYQAVQAWNGCMQRLAALDRVVPEMSLQQAISRLQSIASGTVFQPEGPQAQVHIMGLLEAVGERFDRIWIMGLSDQIWPPGPEPSPFLPVSLQRRLAMPRSSPEHELEYARRITHRLLHSAPEVMLSHPLREEDRELSPSPLIRGIPGIEAQDLQLDPFPDPWMERIGRRHLEGFRDGQGPELSASGRAPGGSGLLRAQAACPFQAFARHRLGAESLEEPVTGLGPPERGIMMHAGLEHFWRRCGDQATLLDLSEQDLEAWVGQAARRAVLDLQRQRPLTLSGEFLGLEEERLSDLLLEWLQLEAERTPFQVRDLEKRLDIRIGGLQLNVVADRLDRLQDGRLVVIDYKAGRHSMSEWFRERLVEPQVPLYSLFCPEPVAGVYFGVVRKGESCFVGLGEESGIVPGCKGFAEHKLARAYSSWQDLLQAWKTSLEALAGEVLRGEAQVSPSTDQACRQCDLASLCRVFEFQDHAIRSGQDVS